ncbi:hypothetical protein CCNA_00225 [Caulobacter vibrioides NA1000]|uniref:Uncharacterized protein n=1 Tax=Caulobacter vibrioides (strain NA1000 / CB15N) TaxID=565050 RepID=A0A0H3C329_CAUVN|nr:hypothetical protein [Caulobacter vibrioides]YP_002515600.2 hypothetical protein CCNA_00225 [Caulobacter vibrioides NA1000]ACL93692.2 hypothetical protein CCNA_00225 [Caulobacter vibrioides NA1000]
MSEIVREARA